MTSWITRLLFAAAVAAAAAGAGAQGQPPLVVGAAVSQTGAHADLAAPYARGLELWASEVNAAGGLLGRPVELRLADDRSVARQAGAAYRRLIEQGAHVLVGPYGSAATLLGAAEAEAARRIFINAAGWSNAVHTRSPQFVFQTAVPYSAYGNVLALVQAQGLARAIILARDDPASVEMANAAAAEAKRLGVQAGEVLVYPESTVDFALQIAAARKTNAQAWIAFAETVDAAEIVKSFKRLDYAPTLLYARGAADPKIKVFLGQDAEHAFGALRYHPGVPTQGNGAFAKAYAARFGSEPPPAAAEAYAAGTVLAEAVRAAGTAETAGLQQALRTLRTRTVLGEHAVDARSGAQTAAQPLVTQVQRGVVQVVWPPELRTAEPVVPYPQWSERLYLR